MLQCSLRIHVGYLLTPCKKLCHCQGQPGTSLGNLGTNFCHLHLARFVVLLRKPDIVYAFKERTYQITSQRLFSLDSRQQIILSCCAALFSQWIATAKTLQICRLDIIDTEIIFAHRVLSMFPSAWFSCVRTCTPPGFVCLGSADVAGVRPC